MGIIIFLLVCWLPICLIHAHNNPPTMDEVYKMQETQRKVAQVAGIATVTAAHKLVTRKGKKSK